MYLNDKTISQNAQTKRSPNFSSRFLLVGNDLASAMAGWYGYPWGHRLPSHRPCHHRTVFLAFWAACLQHHLGMEAPRRGGLEGCVSRWWQLKYYLRSPLPGEMIQIDYIIFFKWVGSTTNQTQYSIPIPSRKMIQCDKHMMFNELV